MSFRQSEVGWNSASSSEAERRGVVRAITSNFWDRSGVINNSTAVPEHEST